MFYVKGTTFSVGLFSHKMKMDDALLGVISCTSRILSDLVYAFAVTDWQVYMGNVKKNLLCLQRSGSSKYLYELYRTLGSASRFSLRKVCQVSQCFVPNCAQNRMQREINTNRTIQGLLIFTTDSYIGVFKCGFDYSSFNYWVCNTIFIHHLTYDFSYKVFLTSHHRNLMIIYII